VKRASSLFLLIVFCYYAFTFKTHYCYHVDSGKRFHGDCEGDIKIADAKGLLGETNFSARKCQCLDPIKDETFKKRNLFQTKNTSADVFMFSCAEKISIPEPETAALLIPEAHCRGVTVTGFPSLRAPPLV
jgi:hypothetical protein